MLVGGTVAAAVTPEQRRKNFMTFTITGAAAHIGPAAAHANGEDPSQAGTMVTATSLHLTAAGKHSSDRAVIADHGHRGHERRVSPFLASFPRASLERSLREPDIHQL